MNILRDQRATWVSRPGWVWLQMGVDRKLSTCAAICRLRRVAVAPGPLRLALLDPSIDRWSYNRTSEFQKGSVSWAGHDWRQQGLFQGRSAWSGRTLSLSDGYEANVWILLARGDASNRRQPRGKAEGALLEQPRNRQTPPGSADSLLCHVEITGDFDFKDHKDRNHFIACEIDSRVVARTYLERKKQGSAASKVQLEAHQAQGQQSGFQHRALLQSKILEPVVVKSVHTCRCIFPFFFSVLFSFFFFPFSFFLFLFALLANFLSAFTQQLLPLPLRVSWEWIGPNFFLG